MKAPLILLVCVVGSVLALRRLSPFETLIPKPMATPPYPDFGEDTVEPKKVKLTEKFFVQPLDHTNPDDDRTWFQRYLMADEFCTTACPVFVHLSGPWKIDGELAVNGSVGLLGREMGAMLVDLEHRYYGKSKPIDSISTGDLAYLSIEQALFDLQNFARTMQQQDEKFSGPWVIYGSGYAASLAAWAKGEFPDLFAGAYASCPRLWARTTVESYYQTVGAALEDASPYCGLNVSTGFEQMAVIVGRGDSETLSKHFTFCDGTIDTRDPMDVQNLYSIMTSFFGEKVETARVGNLTDNICYWMQSDFMGTAFENVAFLVNNDNWGTCFITDYQEVLEWAKNTTYYSEDYYEKQWMYQLCSELGQFQTTLSTIGSNFVPMDHFLIYCTTVFGPEFNLGNLETNMERLNQKYGGLSPKGSDVVYTVASFDPWRALGSHEGTDESPVIMIQEASHSLDLSGPGQNDTSFVQEARVQVSNIIKSWLQA